MELEQPTSLPIRIGWWLGGCLIAVVLYVASIGPMVFVVPTGHGEQYPLLERFYYPLRFVDNTPLEGLLRAYVEWWIKLKGP